MPFSIRRNTQQSSFISPVCFPARRTTRRCFYAVALFGSLATLAGPVTADSGKATAYFVNDPAIVVESHGSEYSGVSSPDLQIAGSLRVYVDAGVAGKVLNWEAWPRLTFKNMPGMMDFRNAGTRSVSLSGKPRFVDLQTQFFIDEADYDTTVAAACQQNAVRLRNQGLNDTQIFGQDRQVKLLVTGQLKYETSGAGKREYEENTQAPDEITVTCKGHEPVVSSVLSIVEEGSTIGRCTLTLHVGFTTTRPDESVRFRFVDDTGKQSNAMTARTRADKSTHFDIPYTLSGGRRSGQIRIVGVNSNFQSDWQDYAADCGPATTDFFTPTPPEVRVKAFQMGRTNYRGFFCPSLLRVRGYVDARNKGGAPTRGDATIWVGGSLKSISGWRADPGEYDEIVHHEEISWPPPGSGGVGNTFTSGTANNAEPPRQTIKVRFNVLRFTEDNRLVGSAEKNLVVFCRQQNESAQIVGNQLVTQQPGVNSTIEQKPAGVNVQMARPAAVPAFAIQSPQGRVRKGEIRLSGGKANSKYLLRFYRKTGGSYQHVRKAQLPKRMSGKRANFDLAALDGSRAWRLQVCPVGTTGISSTQNCRASDFRLPRIGVKKPAGEAPVKGSKFKLLAPKKAN